LTTHYIEEAEFLAVRVAFIDLGSIVALDTPENLMAGVGNWAIDEFQSNHLGGEADFLVPAFIHPQRRQPHSWCNGR
jgi:ABC-type multidrug transport system ATPase subunit